MEKFAAGGLIQLYKKMGLKDPKFFDGKNVVNLYQILGIEPNLNEDGNRVLTPYEILRVFPKFEGGEEKPIVFAIKNRARKIGKYDGQTSTFIYKRQKIKEEKSVIQTLKERYRAAIFAGNDAEAETCLQMIGSLSKGASRDFKDSFYDYTKYYKRMRKQLLIDLFAHFFLLYVQARASIIKSGIIKKNKIYKAYRENFIAQMHDVTLNSDFEVINMTPQIDPVTFGLQNVKKVVINNKEMDSIAEFEIKGKEIKVKTTEEFKNSGAPVAPVEQKTEYVAVQEQKKVVSKPQEEVKQHRFGGGIFESFLGKVRKHFHKVNAVSENIQDESEEEKTPFSKKEKNSSREREIGI